MSRRLRESGFSFLTGTNCLGSVNFVTVCAGPHGHEDLFHEVHVFGAGVIFLSCVIIPLARHGLG